MRMGHGVAPHPKTDLYRIPLHFACGADLTLIRS
jgi:hypothetical protein